MLELLSPAGNLEIYKSVVNAGADAVYFGGELFGARAYATNFSASEAAEAIKYGHLYGVKSYLTVNTLLKNLEIERRLYDYLRSYYENGIDAIIVQDLGVLEFAKTYFPGLELHASTQMNITSAQGANFVKNLGCSRVVTARELSLDEIAAIHQAVDIELEAFVHGALCVCYSGQCLMSSMLGQRSGNRGRCAQPCRLPYQLLDAKCRHLNSGGDYPLSPKDFCAISDLSAMATAGVTSFKIEGRMKKLSYATGVVSVYRKYIDAYLEGRYFTPTKEDERLLFDLGNRSGFTNHYLYEANSSKMLASKSPSHESGIEFNAAEGRKIPVRGEFYARANEPMKLKVNGITFVGERAEAAQNAPTSKETIAEKLNKTGGTPFEFEALEINIEDSTFIPIGRLNALRREALDGLYSALTAPKIEFKAKEFDRTFLFGSASSENEKYTSRNKNILITCKEVEQFLCACDFKKPAIISLALEAVLGDDMLNKLSQAAHRSGKLFYITLPAVCRKGAVQSLLKSKIFDTSIADGMIARSYDELGMLNSLDYPPERIHLDSKIYAYSNVSSAYLDRLGYSQKTAPLELNFKELTHLDLSGSYLTIYGRYLLMITATCQQKNSLGCNKTPGSLYLKDRKGISFPVHNVCAFCYNEIYNSKITSLFSELDKIEELNLCGYRLDFTDESIHEVNSVLALIDSLKPAHSSNPDSYTKGHFNRGVE